MPSFRFSREAAQYVQASAKMCRGRVMAVFNLPAILTYCKGSFFVEKIEKGETAMSLGKETITVNKQALIDVLVALEHRETIQLLSLMTYKKQLEKMAQELEQLF